MVENRTAREWVLRSFLLVIGLVIMAFGVAFSIKAGLGTSPISSLPYVLSCFTPLTVGTATILMHCALIALQILTLRRKFQWMQMLQLPVAFLFGYLCGFTIFCIGFINCTAYVWQWACCVIGIFLVAVGVSAEVCADVTTLAGEGFVLAVCKVAPIKFGTMKVVFDVSLVYIAVILSFLFIGTLSGVREGTVAAAIFVGMISRRLNVSLKKYLTELTSVSQLNKKKRT